MAKNYSLWNSTVRMDAVDEINDVIALVGGIPWEDADLDDTATVHIKPSTRAIALDWAGSERALPADYI